MNSSSSELVARLGSAFAASLALHASFGFVLGVRSGQSRDETAAGFGKAPLQVALREAPAGAARPAAREAAATTGPGAELAHAQADPAIEMPLVHAPFLRTRELDVRPRVSVPVEPDFPEQAVQGRLSGSVVLRLYIDETGKVERAVTVRADPPGVFEQAAERAFKSTRFTPGMKDGHAVKVQMLIEVRFDNLAPPSGARDTPATPPG